MAAAHARHDPAHFNWDCPTTLRYEGRGRGGAAKPFFERPMLISRFRVRNYKGYLDSTHIALTPGFNVIVGRNNAGKTALIEALSLDFAPLPHRSLKIMPSRTTPVDQISVVDVRFTLTPEEVREWIQTAGTFSVPAFGNRPAATEAARFIGTIQESISIDSEWRSSPSAGIHLVRADLVGYEPTFPVNRATGQALEFVAPPNGQLDPGLATLTAAQLDQTLAFRIAQSLRSRIYAFRAERPNVTDSPIQNNPTLLPDARNLSQVLHFLLAAQPHLWERYVAHVRIVFPEICAITVVPVGPAGHNSVRVALWSVPPDTLRGDLAFSLADSGTGVAQVLALLYIATVTEAPQPIIIDEPQSFLHPGAVRKLIDILRLNKRHQYIIVTHSPSVIDATSPDTLLLIKREQSESVVAQLTRGDAQDLRTLLAETGARFADVFGVDTVLWVEGHTEESCFPEILAQLAPDLITGVAIVAVWHTGDFAKKKARGVMQFYERVSNGPRLLPSAVGFLFDRENRSKKERADATKESKGKIQFTSRRMFENYLLDADALAAVASGIEGFSNGATITSTEVRAWLLTHKWDATYFHGAPDPATWTEDTWLREVHGARLIEDLFSELSGQRVTYQKPQHALQLTKYVCERAPGALAEILQLLKLMLGGSARNA